ncbi:MAG: hypothetical protein WDM85_10640 [Caulobacteraceae bacterium]
MARQFELHRFGDLGLESLTLGLLLRRFLALGLALGDALRAQLLQFDLAGEAAFLEFRIDDGGLRLELGHKGLLGFRRGAPGAPRSFLVLVASWFARLIASEAWQSQVQNRPS